MPDVHRVTVVTDATMTRLGYVDRIITVLGRRPERVALQIIDDVEAEPSVAQALGLDGGAEELAAAVEKLRDAVGIEPGFRDLGVAEEDYLAQLPQQARDAYEDQCAPANPRMPMLQDMEALMRAAFYGKE
ncbi:iron-containing alcohol dehydrogenase [Acrocarpospora catenulata]|uniref:iron-containing alcohol dehydrogenase n=1 Tax=Acrocarpospora catenulata TaxID=2836182 RepID=UPI002023AED9|nr:iron-containing alcohol dehydrogenase [Acrocarpospora catenulata]